eukprot:365725-Chlamydomonas_euryale.AAC.36
MEGTMSQRGSSSMHSVNGANVSSASSSSTTVPTCKSSFGFPACACAGSATSTGPGSTAEMPTCAAASAAASFPCTPSKGLRSTAPLALSLTMPLALIAAPGATTVPRTRPSAGLMRLCSGWFGSRASSSTSSGCTSDDASAPSWPSSSPRPRARAPPARDDAASPALGAAAVDAACRRVGVRSAATTSAAAAAGLLTAWPAAATWAVRGDGPPRLLAVSTSTGMRVAIRIAGDACDRLSEEGAPTIADCIHTCARVWEAERRGREHSAAYARSSSRSGT